VGWRLNPEGEVKVVSIMSRIVLDGIVRLIWKRLVERREWASARKAADAEDAAAKEELPIVMVSTAEENEFCPFLLLCKMIMSDA